MRVNNPLWLWGKAMLHYRGHDSRLSNHGATLQRCNLIRNWVSDQKEEKALVALRLFDGTNIRAALKSADLYYQKPDCDKWLFSEGSFIHTYDNQTDPEYVILNGNIQYRKEITADHIFDEVYNCTIIFKQNPLINEVLNIEGLSFNNNV